MNKKWMAVVALLVLMLSVCVLAAAEEPTDPAGSPEEHEHTVSVQIISISQSGHWLHKWCPDCGALLGEVIEDHTYADGVCTVCEWKCTHPTGAAVICYERDRSIKPRWDGNYIIGPGWEITECGACHTVVSRVEATVYESHNEHTRFLPEQECMPHDAVTHALVRICEDCGTEVPEFVPHNCPPSDRPYKDEGDPDTHSRLVRCADCGFWVPQQQAHTWVHYAYTKYDGTGDYHNEVLRCSVCGALKQVPRKHEWKQTSCSAGDSSETHTGLFECTFCGAYKEEEIPHTFAQCGYKNDGNTESHIEVFECTECGAKTEKRAAHRPKLISAERISDTQHRENVVCNMCGLAYTLAPAAHKMVNTLSCFVSNGLMTHTAYWKKCSICGAPDPSSAEVQFHDRRAHDNLSCPLCGEMLKKHNHSIDKNQFYYAVSLNAEQHVPYYACRDFFSDPACMVEVPGDPQPHTFDPVTMKCTVCGYLKEGCEHQYTYKPARNGIQEEQHTVIGTCTGCGKQITITGAHDMQFASATEYVSSGDLQHTRTVTERCSQCGCEKQHTETENHIISSDESSHGCIVCGYKREHDYLLVEYRNNEGWDYHTCVYKCQVCMHEKEERQEHPLETFYEPFDDGMHLATIRCPLCGIGTTMYSKHKFDENGVCACGYHRGDQVDGVLWPQAGQTEDPGDGNMVTPVFCHLTADGKEMPFGYELILLDEAVSENGKAFSFIILPESIPGVPVIGVRFTAQELALLRAFGVKSVYIRPGENDILLLDDVSQALTALTGQEIDELVITLTPESSGAYTAQYDPAGVYITE